MDKFLFYVDKFKYGIIAVFAAYITLFIYLQMSSYTQYFPISPFHEGARLEKEEIEIKPEQIEVNPEQGGPVKNMAKDANDKREKSYENYSQNKSARDIEQSVKDYEKKLFAEAGGETERKKIQEQLDNEKNKSKNQPKTTERREAKTGGDKSYAGSVMVEWVLSNRNPHQNNNYYVRNPGYTCGYGSSGTVTVSIQVNQNGDVTSAVFQAGKSVGANPCMIEQALKYAKMSRFMYSSSAPETQTGTVVYRFVSQ